MACLRDGCRGRGRASGHPESRCRVVLIHGAMINDGQSPGPDGGNGDTDGEPVDLSTGQFVMDKTDLLFGMSFHYI